MKKFKQARRLFTTIQTKYNDYFGGDDEVYISGLTFDFDMLFELCWKTLKEYLLNELGIIDAQTGSPKMILKLSFREGLIEDEKFWIQILNDRNDDTHRYSEISARGYAARIERLYLKEVDKLINKLDKLIQDDDSVILEGIPKDFLMAKKESGMYFDEFLQKVKDENNFQSDLDVFQNWNMIKGRYLNTTTKEMDNF